MLKHWVDWFKAHWEILERDLFHGRRADARDLDCMLHANPKLKEKGMLVVFNPLNQPVTKLLRVNFYFTGLTEEVRMSEQGRKATSFRLNRDYTI
jgi:hypothetical protein